LNAAYDGYRGVFRVWESRSFNGRIDQYCP